MRRCLILLAILCARPLCAQTYTTTFPATENPISQGGSWISGHAAGTDASGGCSPAGDSNFCFADVKTFGGTPGKAEGTIVNGGCNGAGTNCNDSTAVLTGSWGPVQTVQGTIYTNGTLNSGGTDEVELRLLTTISASSITGYEVTCSVSGGNYFGMARWNGPLGNFTNMGANNSVGCTNGDVIKATVDANGVFILYKQTGGVGAFVQEFTTADTTFKTGSPGIGFFTFNGNITDFGLTSFTASASGSGGTSPTSCAGVTDCTAATGNASDVQTSLNSINLDGTTLHIPAGRWTWGNLVSGASAVSYAATHSFTLMGAANIAFTGTPGQANYAFTDDGGTTIVDHVNHGTNGDQPALALSEIAGKSMRVTGISFVQDASSIQSFNGSWLSVNAPSGANIRVDHVHFAITQNNSLAFQTNGTYSGVFDHTVNEGVQGSGFRDHRTCPGNDDWTVPGNFGTNTSGWRYYESSIFHNFSNDGVCGGRIVYRFNTQYMTGAGPTPTEPLQTHGTASATDSRGQRAFEVYGNIFQNPHYVSDTVMEMTSGSGLVFGNTMTPASQGSCAATPCGWKNFMRVAINRSLDVPPNYDYTAPPGGWGFCGTANGSGNGTGSAWDENNPASSGRKCIDSVGNGAGDLLSGSFPNKCNITLNPACNIFTGQWPRQAQEPVYEWMDSWTSPGTGGAVFWGGFSTVTIPNQDVYLDCSPGGPSGCTSFFGTVGVGHGNLPPTNPSSYSNAPNCVIGVAYWYTAGGNWNQSGNSFGQGQLYKCTATNTWSLYYTPLTYPHPLIASPGGAVTVAPPNEVFGNINLGSSSAAQVATVTNSTGATITINSVIISPSGGTPAGDFSNIANTCSGQIAIGGTCQVTTKFTPSILGNESAQLTVSTTGGNVSVGLTGTGIGTTPVATITPTSLAFGNVIVNQLPILSVNLQNTGNAALTVTSIAMGGTYYTQTNSCPASLAVNASCTIQVTFAPTATGNASGTLTITDNAANSPQTVSATGAGILVPSVSTGVILNGAAVQ